PGNRTLRRVAGPRRSAAVRVDRGLSHRRCPGEAQGDRPLRAVARCGRRHDGRAAPQPKVHQRVPGRRTMVATFEFATAGRISFGAGVRHQLGQVVADLGRRALFVTGSRPERYAALHEALVDAGVAVDTVSVAGEPTV